MAIKDRWVSDYPTALGPVSIPINEKLIEYIDMLYYILDVDITYEKWSNMNQDEKLTFMRDIKIKKITQ